MDRDVKTYRGRSLEEVLPQIRAELGPDAVVLRRREGLTGGVGGFFQRPYVEVEASGPDGGAAMRAAAQAALETRNDRATAEGLASPAIQLLLDQAAPFADQLHAAQHHEAERSAAERAADILGSTAMSDPGLYGPQPNVAPAQPRPASPEPDLLSPDLVVPDVFGPPLPDPAAVLGPDPPSFSPPVAPEPVVLDGDEDGDQDAAPDAFSAPEPARAPGDPAPSAALLAPRPAAAATAERRLVLAGLDSGLAADVVGEAVVHAVPFSSPRALKKLVRAGLARRIPVLTGRGPLPRSLAFVGTGGAGKTTAVGHLAAAYAAAGSLPVLAVALRTADGGAALRSRLAPAGVAVHAAEDGAEARRILDVARGAMVIVDTAPVSLRDRERIAALAADLAALDLHEVHLALPATLSAAASAELARALGDVGLTHVALTKADETEHPGAPVGFCITSGGPLSYVCERDGIAPADAAALALRLIP